MTSEMLKAKVQLLEALVDIQVALEKLSMVEDEGLHPHGQKVQAAGRGYLRP